MGQNQNYERKPINNPCVDERSNFQFQNKYLLLHKLYYERRKMHFLFYHRLTDWLQAILQFFLLWDNLFGCKYLLHPPTSLIICRMYLNHSRLLHFFTLHRTLCHQSHHSGASSSVPTNHLIFL